jgi:hypothetical protein
MTMMVTAKTRTVVGRHTCCSCHGLLILRRYVDGPAKSGLLYHLKTCLGGRPDCHFDVRGQVIRTITTTTGRLGRVEPSEQVRAKDDDSTSGDETPY